LPISQIEAARSANAATAIAIAARSSMREDARAPQVKGASSSRTGA
jgi:hypothetical protein